MNFNELIRKASAANNAGRHQLAQQLASQAISLEPGNPNGYGELASACVALLQYEAAEENCRHGLELEPDNIWLIQILILSLNGQKRFEEALPVANSLIELIPESSHSHLRKGWVLSGLSRHEEALDFYRNAVQLDPDNSHTHFHLGVGLLNLDNSQDAEPHFRASLKLKPDDASALNNLGVCLQKQHRMKDAALAYKAAILIDPTQDVSKSNAKYAISQFLSYGAILAVLIQLTAIAAFFVLYASKLDPAIKGVIALIGGLVTVALMAAAIFGGRIIRTRQLESADPQILAIYKSLNQDRTID